MPGCDVRHCRLRHFPYDYHVLERPVVLHTQRGVRKVMSDLTLVRRVMDHVLIEDLGPVLGLFGDEVALTVLRPGSGSGSFEQLSGKQAVCDYFARLGGIVTFWQMRFFDQQNHVLVLGQERYTTTRGMESATDFAMVWQIRDGVITELLIVEDLTILLAGRAGTFVPVSGTASGLKPTGYLGPLHLTRSAPRPNFQAFNFPHPTTQRISAAH
jgi:ketosteroid isomerase-like protein